MSFKESIASARPMAPPVRPSTSGSDRIVRKIAIRLAPSAIRVVISGVRRDTRTSKTPARFAQANSRMKLTASISTSMGPRALMASCC